ncbi:hypothetical protein QJ857_gp0786 [Tupanvirus soda lake]|uniref:Uncharacterized protein n=2 Tax=Tupanvirus TaxID=2094720 RepID=A0A6N1NV71_9VIRU|nr:hypothetical protein QJ857_gp0786 [Tupanvirus soda lake]QKU35263.1 hypothetical protein [Tupanvirus soda lake]
MASNLARIIIEQFIDIVQKASERCCIPWDKCALRIVSRQYIDTLVIEISHIDPCGEDPLANFIPVPLITIDFTDIKEKNLESSKWIGYLERKASELLNKIEARRGNIISNVCCPPKKPECVPVNNCNCTYREEYYLCPTKKGCNDKPYDDWGKPCKKSKVKCPSYEEPECPIKISTDKKSKVKCPSYEEPECPIKISTDKKSKCWQLKEKKYWELNEKKCVVVDDECPKKCEEKTWNIIEKKCKYSDKKPKCPKKCVSVNSSTDDDDTDTDWDSHSCTELKYKNKCSEKKN